MGSSLTPRGTPAGALSGLHRLNTMLDQMFGTWPLPESGSSLTSAWLPPVDVFEDKDAVKIVAEIPGVRPEDLQLSIENNVLTIRGEKRQTSEDTTDRVHRYERSYGMFERSFVLPATVDPDRIEATIDGGVLTISVPKVEKARPRQIEVKGGSGTGKQGAVGSGSPSGTQGGRRANS
jgi:HSP20 family protein